MCYAPDRLAAFARLRHGPLAWYLFLRLADDPAADPAAVAAEVGMNGTAARRAARQLVADGALVPTDRGLEPGPAFAPAHRVVRPSPPDPPPPPLMVNGPDDRPRPAGTAPADPDRERAWAWVCDQVERIFPGRDLGISLARYVGLGWDPVLLYRALTEVMTWRTAPRSVRAFLRFLEAWAADPPAVDPATLPPELGGTPAAARSRAAGPPAAPVGRIDRRREELRALLDRIPEPEPAEVYRVRSA